MQKAVCFVRGAGLVASCASPPHRVPAKTAARPSASRPTAGGTVRPAPQRDGAPAAFPAAPTAAPSKEPVTKAPGSQLDPTIYRLAAGDQVQIDVFNEPELTLAALVESSGTINYPLLGRVQAAGLTVRQLETRIASGLRGDYLVNPDVRVSIARYRPIFVTGQVRRVGSYPYTIGMTVDRALAMAGGLTEFASSKKVYVQHESTPESHREKVDLDYPIYPGDTVVVEERLF